MAGRRVRIVVSGKVQGVFFRQSMKVAANDNGVAGWVKNLKDGRVEAVLEGDPDNVDKVVQWSREGPANSRVMGTDMHDEEFTGEFSTFDVLY